MARIKAIFLIALLTLSSSVLAQPSPPSAVSQTMLKQVGIDQKLGTALPLDLTFVDETGKTVRLGDYFGKRPVVLSLVYYGCPSLCTMTLNSMSAAFKPLPLEMAKDFEVVTVSFDPSEKPELAAEKKAAYVKQYGKMGAEAGWHFLTGDQESIRQLTETVGFRYVYDPNTKQFAHGSAIMVATTEGKLSHYLYGLEYAPKDLRLALVEASQNKIGSLADQVLLLCFEYDPTSGKYGFVIMSAIRIDGILTVGALGTFIGIMLLRDRRKVLLAGAGRPADTTRVNSRAARTEL